MVTQKIRIYYPYSPYPPRDGASYVVFDQVRAFAELGAQVEHVFWKYSGSQNTSLEQCPKNVISKPLHLSDTESFMRRSWRVGRALFSSLASPEIYYYPPNQYRKIQEPVDLAIYHYSFAYPWVIQASSLEKRRVVVFHNLESELFKIRANQLSLGAPIHYLNSSKLRHHENQLKDLVDELWFISPLDLKKYKNRIENKSCCIRFVPPGFSNLFHQDRVLKFQQRIGNSHRQHPVLGFIGNLEFLPNYEGVLWIIERLAPLLAQEGFAGKIRIVGKGASSTLLDRASRYSFIKIEGFVPDVEDFWSDLDFSLIPHVSGSGVRIKLIESLASGVPSLTTSEGRDRIHPGLQNHPLLKTSDDPAEWSKWILDSRHMSLRAKMSELPLAKELDSMMIYGELLKELQ